MVISDGIPAVPQNRKFSEFRSEPFSGRENNSEFRSLDKILKQTLGIHFRTFQQNGKQLGIPFRGTEIEANSRNSLPSPSAEEKTTLNSVAWNKNGSKLSAFRSEPFRGRENNSEQNAAAAVSDSIQIETSCRGRKNDCYNIFTAIKPGLQYN